MRSFLTFSAIFAYFAVWSVLAAAANVHQVFGLMVGGALFVGTVKLVDARRRY